MKRHPRKIWDDSEIPSLRERYQAGLVSARQIAADYRVSIETVRRMLRGETYFNLAQSAAAPEPNLEALAAVAAQLAQPEEDAALARFMAETRVQSDQLIKEIFGEKPAQGDVPNLDRVESEAPPLDDAGEAGGF